MLGSRRAQLPSILEKYSASIPYPNGSRRYLSWQSPLDSAKSLPKSNYREGVSEHATSFRRPYTKHVGANMITAYANPFDSLFNLQQAVDSRLSSDWLQEQTTSQGPFPPINVFQQGTDLLAIIELPGVEKSSLEVQAKENTIRIAGKKAISYPEDVSVHRRERISGEFDRTISLPVQLDPDRIKAEYREGILALFLPRSEGDKPRSIAIS
jgi:HSP20 family protein